MAHSPLTYIKNAKTPTLILHGEDDVRVPISQGKEFYRGLKVMGVDTNFLELQREGHNITNRKTQIGVVKKILSWYDKYLLKGEN